MHLGCKTDRVGGGLRFFDDVTITFVILVLIFLYVHFSNRKGFTARKKAGPSSMGYVCASI